jgi:hypothetical protein
MFIGHFAVGFAAKQAAPKTSLGTLFFAAQFVDLLWPLLLMAGLESVRVVPGITVVTPFDFEFYPYSHSLLTNLGWGALAYLVYKYACKGSTRAALVLGLAVVSHWFLDLIVHRPDLPLTPDGETLVGLGLWDSLPATLLLEGAIFVAGVAVYLRATEARDRIGAYGIWGLVAVLVAAHLNNLFGPPPEGLSNFQIGLFSNLQWLFVLLAFWVDRHRQTRAG